MAGFDLDPVGVDRRTVLSILSWRAWDSHDSLFRPTGRLRQGKNVEKTMAINRLMLVCSDCGEDLVIARLQIGMDGKWLPSRVSAEDYEKWFLEHSDHGHGEPIQLNVALKSENDIGVRIAED